jgi:hypothetical protein
MRTGECPSPSASDGCSEEAEEERPMIKPKRVGELEKVLTKVARKLGLPPGFKARIFGPGHWNVRSDAKLRNVR